MVICGAYHISKLIWSPGSLPITSTCYSFQSPGQHPSPSHLLPYPKIPVPSWQPLVFLITLSLVLFSLFSIPLSSSLLQIALVTSSLLFMFSLFFLCSGLFQMFLAVLSLISKIKNLPLNHTAELPYHQFIHQATSHQLQGTSSSTTPGLLKAVTSMPRRARLACKPDSSCSGLKCHNHPAGLGAHVVGTQWAGWCWGPRMF